MKKSKWIKMGSYMIAWQGQKGKLSIEKVYWKVKYILILVFKIIKIIIILAEKFYKTDSAYEQGWTRISSATGTKRAFSNWLNSDHRYWLQYLWSIRPRQHGWSARVSQLTITPSENVLHIISANLVVWRKASEKIKGGWKGEGKRLMTRSREIRKGERAHRERGRKRLLTEMLWRANEAEQLSGRKEKQSEIHIKEGKFPISVAFRRFLDFLIF